MSLRLSWLRRPDYRKSRTFAASLVDKTAKREGSALYYETQDVRLFAAVQRDLVQRGRSQLLAVEPVPGNGSQAEWEEFLRSKAGTPLHVVCAPEPELVRAIAAVWPPDRRQSPAVFLCHRHLAQELLELVHAAGVDPTDRFYRAAEQALGGVARWRRFLAAEPPRRLRALDPWLQRNGAQIAAQLARGEGAVTTTELLDEKLAVVQDRLADRRGNLRNRERTRRLLMLLQLELNGRGDPESYARIITEQLRRRNGRASARRSILDTGRSSLDG